MDKKVIVRIALIVIIFAVGIMWNNSTKTTPVQDVEVIDTPQETSTSSYLVYPQGWIKKESGGIAFAFPGFLAVKYISTSEWPPSIIVLKQKYSCISSEDTASPSTSVKEFSSNKVSYCEKITSEGAAGSQYRQYEYTVKYREDTLLLNFILRFPQCMNYDEPEQSQCVIDQKYDVRSLAEQILTSVTEI